MSGASKSTAIETPVARPRTVRRVRWRRATSTAGWYAVLVAIAIVTVFPFAWMFLTSLKGPGDQLMSVPPQFLPTDPTLAAYQRVLDALPIPTSS